MPFCPECEAEYEAGIATCSDCGTSLVDALPAEPEAAPDDAHGEPVAMRNFANAAEANMVESLLADNGIRAFVSGGDFTVAPSGFSDEIVLMVDERDLERATDLYEAYFGDAAVDSAVEAPTTTDDPSESGGGA